MGTPVLLPLDWMSGLIEAMRRRVLAFSRNQEHQVGSGTRGFVLAPPVMLLCAPLILAALLVPKFTSYIDVEV